MYCWELYFFSFWGFFSGIRQFVLSLSGILCWREERIGLLPNLWTSSFVSLDASLYVCSLCFACLFFFFLILLSGVVFGALGLSSCWPGIEPQPPVLGSQSLSHWITRGSTCLGFFNVFVWLVRVLVAARGIFDLLAARGILSCSIQTLSCNQQTLVPWPGIQPRPPALGAWNIFDIWTDFPKIKI